MATETTTAWCLYYGSLDFPLAVRGHGYSVVVPDRATRFASREEAEAALRRLSEPHTYLDQGGVRREHAPGVQQLHNLGRIYADVAAVRV